MPRFRGGTVVDGPVLIDRSEHAIPDRKSVILFGAGLFASAAGGDVVGQMPRPELVRVARVCREAQLEQTLGLTRQIQDHDAVSGMIVQSHRTPEHAAPVVARAQRALPLGE